MIALVVDLDRPTGGIIRTPQQPLIDLRDSLDDRCSAALDDPAL